MTWRNKDWENPFSKSNIKKIDSATLVCEMKDGTYISDSVRRIKEVAFENGADAMLDALKRQGTRGHLFDDSILTPEGDVIGLKGYDTCLMETGTFVFIPETRIPL